jgi:excisionase family DNA binding protein
MLPQLFDSKEAAKYLGLSAGTLEKWRCLKQGPGYTKVGGRVRYSEGDLQKFLETGKKRAKVQ